MPELPESVVIARQMDRLLRTKIVASVAISQSKCLNRDEADYYRLLPGQLIDRVVHLGKWIVIGFESGDRLLISLGMGGEILQLAPGAALPDKSRMHVRFNDETGFYITFWWFGYVHLALKGEAHAMTDALGPDPLTLSVGQFRDLLSGRRGGVKTFLLNQKRICGIGNFYIQEILFRARLHPLRSIPSLSQAEIAELYRAIRDVLQQSIDLGSSSYELDFLGEKGQFDLQKLSIAYQENAVCPVCGARAEKIQTGSTSQFICPFCQPLNP